MKTIPLITLAIALFITTVPCTSLAAEATPQVTYEYATLRWSGRENTHLIRPDGTTEILGGQFKSTPRPVRVDERSFYMNLAMNALAREGYELVAMTHDDYVMKRRVSKEPR